MKITKSLGKKASNILADWTAAGVPNDITKYEAFNLTNGLVGDPYGKNHSYVCVRAIDVAVEYAKKLDK
jgi:hypothetical protein